MDTELINRLATASHAGTASFAEIMPALIANNVESYRVDYRERTITYYDIKSGTHTVTLAAPSVEIPDAFDAAQVTAAIRGAQRGEVRYPEFVSRTMAAGCVGYIAWLSGRQVTYFGRRGETHVEQFPR